MDAVKRILTIVPLWICMMLIVASGSAVKGQSLEAKQTNTISRISYWEYLPESYSDEDKLPVIIFLHGKGERGDGSEAGLEKVLTWGPLRHAKNGKLGSFSHNGQTSSFIVLAPQLNKPASFWKPELIDEFINYALHTYNIDLKRIYLTGLSMGGNGTWAYAYSDFNEPNKLAAIAPVAGWGNEDKVCIIKERNIPVWAFHGEEDQAVPFIQGEGIFKALQHCYGSKDTGNKFSAYPQIGHNSWERAYFPGDKWHSPNLYQWFLAHSLADPPSVGFTAVSETSESEENPVTLRLLAELPSSISETSGLAIGPDGKIWSHNDSGHGPYLMQIDTTGNVPEFKKIIYSSNFDWEDLATDSHGNVYIGDIGNNENIRKKLIVYKVSLYDTSKRVNAEAINFTYEDQKEFPPPAEKLNFDAEAMIFHRDSLYIFTKNRTQPYNGIVKVYRIPSVPGTYEAKLVDSLQLGQGPMLDNWITGADISPDGKTLALLSHRKIWLIQCFGSAFSDGEVTELTLDTFSQKEGVVFSGNSKLYISDERFKKVLGGYIYELNITTWLSKDCD